MNISGVLVHANPEKIDEVKEELLKISGVEIHAATEEGRLVVTVEKDDFQQMVDTVVNFHHCEGVLSAVLIYQYSNDDENSEEEISI
jgi:nitrate reductase NapD